MTDRRRGHAWPLLFLLLLVSACDFDPAGQSIQIDPRCQSAVDNDPKVKELQANSAGALANFGLTHLSALSDARQAANSRCLKALGAIRQGGVERPRAPTSSPMNY
jgi:hypothetical protein